MKVSVISRISIAANRNEVFKYLTDPSYHFLWNPHLQSLTPMHTLKQGSKYKTTSLLLGVRVKGNNLISKSVPEREFQIENNTGMIKYRVAYQLHTKNKFTEVVCTTVVSTNNKAFAFSTPILKLLAQRELQSDLKALKIAVEHRLE